MRPQDLLDPLIGGPGTKGYPHGAAPLHRSQIAARRWNLLRGDLPLPLAVIQRDALAGNLRWMQQFAQEQGVELAPHGKTTMSPQLFAAQLAAGAWGITFANVTQARLGLASGVRRALIANQVVATADLDAIAAVLDETAGARLLFLVDSLAQLELIEAWHRARGEAPAALEVLLELGLDGGRTGCRSHGTALALARRLRSSLAFKLVGIECYEGLWATGRSVDDEALVQGLLQRVAEVALECDQERLFEGDEVLVSAGGSAIFDLVAPRLKLVLSKPVRGVLRSGCYVTHDHGSYKRYLAAMDQRLGCGHGLQAALQVWAMVQSVPEAGLAVLTAGKRDCSYDIEMPIPAAWCRRGQAMPTAAPADWKVSAMNDQHAYLRFASAQTPPQVGDLVGLGISHPCTTFDKWRWMAVVDERYDVVDAITTCF
ncbi:MAG: amino acid deaminase [Burkholderiaceae bacterium]|nr:amino acid deaminase [Burkholderiaceae bacterium]